MTVSSRKDFLESVALEAQLLAEGVPIVSSVTTELTIAFTEDGRSRNINLVLSDSTSEQAVQGFRDTMLALFFGAAWKVLDLLVELSISNDSSIAPRRQWTATDKAAALTAGRGVLPILPPEVWGACCSIYKATLDSRNALVHRIATVGLYGELSGQAKDGSTLTPLSREEQTAICELAQFLIVAVEHNGLNNRQMHRLLARLSLLDRLHERTDLPATFEGEIVRVLFDLPQDGVVPIARLKASAAEVSHLIGVDLVLRMLETGVTFRGEIENVSEESLHFDPTNPPTWLHRSLMLT